MRTGEPMFVKIVMTFPLMIEMPSGSVVNTCVVEFNQLV